ncbi:MAG: hypothetical protein C4523_05080 [Myxococcales bacterium]|nr:MAG: hypothetical protein C4523_05080 [Myxococcales bacterium]
MRNTMTRLALLVAIAFTLTAVGMPASAAAAGKLLVMPVQDKTNYDVEKLEKFKNEFTDAYKKLRNLGGADGDKVKAAMEYIKAKFADDPGCLTSPCQVKLLAETGTDVVAVLIVKSSDEYAAKFEAVALEKEKGILQAKAEGGWLSDEKASEAAKRLAYRVVFLNDSDKSDERAKRLMGVLGIKKELLAADSDEAIAKYKEKVKAEAEAKEKERKKKLDRDEDKGKGKGKKSKD